MNISISSGALAPSNVSRTGGFAYSTENRLFTATAATLTINFVGTSAGTCGLIVDNIGVNYVGPLPIELLNFNCELNTQNQVVIDWSTANEINNNYFAIERSSDGLDWTNIHNIKGAGNSHVIIEYQTVDSVPLYGVSYYRLSQIDLDGKLTYYDAKSIFLETKKISEIYPNPFGEENIYLPVNGDVDINEIRIFDSYGKDCSSKLKLIYNFSNLLVCRLEDCQSGVFFLQIGRENFKLLKK